MRGRETRRWLLLLACTLAAIGCERTAERVNDTSTGELASLLGGEVAPGYLRAIDAREFRFPQDHGAHRGFRNEWWYLTGNLDGTDGHRYGYELTLFRFALSPTTAPGGASSWVASDVFIGHFAVTDVAAGRFHVAEQFARGAAGLAGAQSAPVRVWVNNWQLRQRSAAGERSSWSVSAETNNLALELTLDALKPPVLHGTAGRSQKSADPNNASYYYSLPRLRTVGEISIEGRRIAVSGLSWLDREWSSSALAAHQVGWDWFALQFDDNSELMFYQLRNSDGTIDEFSSGSLIAADGHRTALTYADVTLDVLAYWDSPRGGRYPQGWRLRVPARNIDLRIRPLLPEQELDTSVRYWEGAVDVVGTIGAKRVTGRGYVELTGYASGERRVIRR